MDEKNIPKPKRFEIDLRPMFNDPEISDVHFLVEGQTVYAHKFVLAMGSPVFKSMFYGDLKEQREEIEIEDLSLIGFKNALRYIYGFEMNYELTDLHEIYMVADMYLLNGFDRAFFNYVCRKLNSKNSCLIYDQLVKIGERVEVWRKFVKGQITNNSRAFFESDHFTQIDQETLISLLSMDQLEIDEFDLLVAVSKWVDCEVQRQGLSVNDENRRKVFEPIKGYILFAALKPEEIMDCNEGVRLLTDDEEMALMRHLLNKKLSKKNQKNRPLTIKPKTARKDGTTRKVYSGAGSFGYIAVHDGARISVNRKISVRSIYTALPEDAQDRCASIQDSSGVDLGLKIRNLVQDGRLCFSFITPFVMEPDRDYKLCLKGSSLDLMKGLEKEIVLQSENGIVFKVGNFRDDNFYHYVKGFEFRPF